MTLEIRFSVDGDDQKLLQMLKMKLNKKSWKRLFLDLSRDYSLSCVKTMFKRNSNRSSTRHTPFPEC